MTILNAKDRPVGAPFLPDLSEALSGLSQPLMIYQVQKQMRPTGQVFESFTPIGFEGIVQPMKPFLILLKPEGQRDFKWYTLHAKTGLPLKIDDIIYYLNYRYRVTGIYDYSQYGYYSYDLVQDFSSSSPTPVPAQQAMNKFLQDVVITSPLSVTLNVSPNVPDATVAKWAVYGPSGQKIDVPGTVKVLSTSQVRITVPVAGTYRVIGES